MMPDPMAKMETELMSGRELLLSIDNGSTKTSISFAVPNPDEIELPVIRPLCFKDGEVDCPMIIGEYQPDGTLTEGYDLKKKLDQGVLNECDIVRYAKLALHHDEETREIRERVEAYTKARGMTPEDLIAAYYASVVRKSKEIIKQMGYDEDIDKMPLKLFISYPVIWSALTRGALKRAAEKISDSSVLVPEPLCAAASIMLDEIMKAGKEKMKIKLKAGDYVMVVDCGGGSIDVALSRLCGDPTNLNAQIEILRPAQGATAGSTAINREFVRWLREEKFKGNALREQASNLNLSEEELLARASVAFDQLKVLFSQDVKLYYMTVRGVDGVTGSTHLTIELDYETIASFFDVVISRIELLLQSVLAGFDNVKAPEKLKSIVLCGGFGSSWYLRSKITALFHGIDIMLPQTKDNQKLAVSRGAILRYLRPIQKPMWSLLVHRAEHFDPDVHKDAVATRTDNRSARTVPKKRARPLPKSNSPRYKWSVANLDIVKKDPLDGRPVVTERVLHILDGKTGETNHVWKYYFVEYESDDQQILIQTEVYWAPGMAGIHDHDPLRSYTGSVSRRRQELPLRTCFEEYAVVDTVLSPKSYNLKPELTKQGGKMVRVWVVPSCVVLERTQDEIKLSLMIRKESELKDDHGRLDERIKPTFRADRDHFETIHNKKHPTLSAEQDTELEQPRSKMVKRENTKVNMKIEV